MNVVTQKCVVCKQNGMLEDVDALGFLRWSELGEDILRWSRLCQGSTRTSVSC
jgi:hypothetical protein